MSSFVPASCTFRTEKKLSAHKKAPCEGANLCPLREWAGALSSKVNGVHCSPQQSDAQRGAE